MTVLAYILTILMIGDICVSWLITGRPRPPRTILDNTVGTVQYALVIWVLLTFASQR